MSAIDHLHTTPRHRYEAASIAHEFSQRRPTVGEYVRDVLFAAALCLVGLALIALRIWIYLPASLHVSG